MASNKIQIEYGVVGKKETEVRTYSMPYTSRGERFQRARIKVGDVFQRGLCEELTEDILFIHPPYTITGVKITDL